MDNEEFYVSEKWRAKRRAILRRDGYIDQVQKRYGKIVEATIVHHALPLGEYPEYRFADWNLVSVSMATHNKLHDHETGRLSPMGMELKRRIAKKQGINMTRKILVVGLPHTGKTTYVRDHLGNGLAYDLDYISAAFRLQEAHEERHEDARRMANDLMRSFANNVLDYTDTAYIIRTAPTQEEIETIEPDRLVVCETEHSVMRNDSVAYDTAYMKKRIASAIRWATDRGVEIERVRA